MSAPALPLEVVDDEAAAGELVAAAVADLLARGGGPVVLGCPSGRTPRTSYAAIGRTVAERGFDVARLRIVMMDEYVEADGAGGFRCIDRSLPHSCGRFADDELVPLLGGGAPVDVRFPDPADPDRYEEEIAALGGIDLFLLAAGATDGHVAFNPPGSAPDGPTRVVELAETTRVDNLGTFPTLGTLDRVPTHGVSVGLGTIVRHSRSAVLLLLGAHKHAALDRTLAAPAFDPAWPASIVRELRDVRVVADRAAARG